MQVTVESTQGREKRMSVSVPADRIEKEIEKRLKNISRSVKLKGFRPGKVPLKVVASHYGSRVRKEVVNEVTQKSFSEALSKENIQLVGVPRFEQRSDEPGKNLVFDAIFEVMPTVDVTPIENVTIEKPVAEISDSDIDAMMNKLCKQRASWNEVNRAAQLEDRINIDFTGTIEGEGFEGNSGQQVDLVLGSKSYIQGFEEGLIGASAGEERTLELSFPEGYHSEYLAGRPVQFKVKINSVSEAVLPEIDAEFVKSFDIEDGNVETLRNELRKTMEEELREAISDHIKQQVMDQLYTENSVELSPVQVEEQIDILMAQLKETLKKQGISGANLNLERSAFEPRARRRVALGMIINEIIKQQNLIADPDKIRKKVESLAASYDNPEQVIEWYYADQSRLANIEAMVLEENVVEWVMNGAKVTEKMTNFAEFMESRRNQ